MTVKAVFLCLLFGLVSAALSIVGSGMLFFPGMVWGIATGVYCNFFGVKRLNVFLFICWVAICGIAYTAAFFLVTMGPKIDWSPSPISFVLAGLVGSFITILGFTLLIKQVSFYQAVIFVLTGTILGLSYYLGEVPGLNLQIVMLFLVWQTGMFLLLGYFGLSEEFGTLTRDSNQPSPESTVKIGEVKKREPQE